MKRFRVKTKTSPKDSERELQNFLYQKKPGTGAPAEEANTNKKKIEGIKRKTERVRDKRRESKESTANKQS